MRERTIENKLVTEIKKIGGICWKFTAPSVSGVPDRIILYKGTAYFVETKAPGKKPRPLQRKIHRDLAKQGFHVWVIDSMEQLSLFIDYLTDISIRNTQEEEKHE